MALGSQPSFSQIVNEWSESYSAGKITPSTGSPVSMRQFLRGLPIGSDLTGYVPDFYDSTSGIASSGNLAMSSFKNTNAEQPAQICLQGFLSDWYAYQRFSSQPYWDGYSTGAPLTIHVVNDPSYRYRGQATHVYSYYEDPELQGHSKWHTIVDWVTGAQASINGGTGYFSSTPQLYTQNQSSYGEMSCRLTHHRLIPRWNNDYYINYTRLGNNSGSWSGQYLLPGKWYVSQVRNQPVTNSSDNAAGPQTSYVVTVPAGQAYLLQTYSTGYDGNPTYGYYPTSSNGDPVYITVSWWYNSQATAFYVNKSATSQTLTFPNGLTPQYDKSSNFLYNSGAFWFGTNYHRDYLLARTY